jgi:hypothetical protein
MSKEGLIALWKPLRPFVSSGGTLPISPESSRFAAAPPRRLHRHKSPPSVLLVRHIGA